MSNHYIIKCKHCEIIISQCRCPASDKKVRWGDCGCAVSEPPSMKMTIPNKELELKVETERANKLQLVAGRYQFMWEAAQLCINKIDDHLEYDFPPHKTFESVQKEVQKHLKIYTEAVSGLLKKRGS